MDTFIPELKALLQQQRNNFDHYRGDPPGGRSEGDLEHFAVMTHVTLCQLISKLIDYYSGNLLDQGESFSVHRLQFVRGGKSDPPPDDDAPPGAA